MSPSTRPTKTILSLQTLTVFPYQVSFSYNETGRRIPSSKRVLSWTFGLADRPSLEQGQSGIACCGPEHTVTAVWSVRSGKLLLRVNGQTVAIPNETTDMPEEVGPASSTSRNLWRKQVDVSWDMSFAPNDNPGTSGERASSSATSKLHLQLLAYATMPSHTNRQYDLWVNGRSFFQLPRLPQVGVTAYVPTHRLPIDATAPTLASHREAPRTRYEEEVLFQQALIRSQQESRHRQNLPPWDRVEEEKMEVDQEMDWCRRYAYYPHWDGLSEEVSLDGIEPVS